MKLDLTLTPGIQGILRMNEDMERGRNLIGYRGVLINLVDKTVEFKADILPLDEEVVKMIESIVAVAKSEEAIYEASKHLLLDDEYMVRDTVMTFELESYKKTLEKLDYMHGALVDGNRFFIDALARLTLEERIRAYQVLMTRTASNMDSCSRDRGDRLKAAQDSMYKSLFIKDYNAARDIKLISNMPTLTTEELLFVLQYESTIARYQTAWLSENVFIQLMMGNKNVSTPYIYKKHHQIMEALVDIPEWLAKYL